MLCRFGHHHDSLQLKEAASPLPIPSSLMEVNATNYHDRRKMEMNLKSPQKKKCPQIWDFSASAV